MTEEEYEEQLACEERPPRVTHKTKGISEAKKQALLYARQHKQYERRIYPLFLRALRKQLEPVINWITEFGTDPPLEALVKPSIFRKPMQQAYGMVAVTAARREYYYMKGIEEKGLIDFLVEKWRALFNDYATTYAYRVESDLSETTKEEIRRALAYAYENQLNANQTAAYIKKSVYNQISRKRAVVIARTEATTASNLGKEAGAKEWLKESGQQGYKQWLGRADSRERGFGTDHGHWAMNDDIIPMEQDWELTDDKGVVSYGQRPGDTRLPANQRVNCRCSQLFMSARRYERMQQGQ